MNTSLYESNDHELYAYINAEKERQRGSLELIASENFTSAGVIECLGSCLTNKYAEGLPGKRYYGGNEVVDKIETLCINRALNAFKLSPEEWAVNVQPYSGSTANMAVYFGLLQPHDRIMGLDLPSGGHLTHGFYTAKKKVSATSVYYESIPYQVGDNGRIDYDGLEKMVAIVKPKLIICGYSAYSFDLDYERFRRIADSVGAYLMCDMAHFSGFVVTGLLKNPFKWCDVVTSTTHKTLRGPRSGMIFCKKGLEQRINEAVFPGLQGGPHIHQIAGLAHQLLEVQGEDFYRYMCQVRANASQLATELGKLGHYVVGGGTENHMLLMNVKDIGLNGWKAEKALEVANISVNKNTIYGDKSALNPSGIRIGTPCVTTRGLKREDMAWVAETIDKVLRIAVRYADLEKSVFCSQIENCDEILKIRDEVKIKMNGLPFYS